MSTDSSTEGQPGIAANSDEDVEGHRISMNDDDVEGHLRVANSDDDVEGHRVQLNDDDVEGHAVRH